MKRTGVQLVADDCNITLADDDVRIDFRDAIANCQRDCSELFKNFLPGYVPDISPAFEDWLERLRNQVNLQMRDALIASLRIKRSNGHWPDIEATARRCLEIDPLNEDATLSLAEATAMSGNKLQAVRLLDRYTDDLDLHVSKLGLPSALLRQRISDRLPSVKSDMVGRELEIASITAMIRQMRSGFGNGYLMIGDSGVGKTRMIEEAMRVATLEGVSVVATQCVLSDAEYPLSALTKLVSIVQGLPGALGCSPSSLKRLGTLTNDRPNQSRNPEDLGLLMAHYDSIKQAIIELVGAVTHEVRLLFVIDDFDYADRWSTEIIADLIQASRSQRLVVLAAARSTQGPVATLLALDKGLQAHVLKPLGPIESRTLIQQLTSKRHGGLSDDLQNLYVEMAGGNPLSIHELARHWENCGHVAPIPPSIESALERRLASLDRFGSNLLEAIVLLARNATIDRLARLFALSESDAISRIESLELSGAALWESGKLRCTHGRLAELVRSRMSSTASVSMHVKIAEILRPELQPPHDSRILWDCARHYRLAGNYHAAVEMLSSCTDRLLKIGLPQEAVSIWERALALSQTDEERVLAHERLIQALRANGEFSRISLAATEIARLRARLEIKSPVWSDWQIDVLEARMCALENMESIFVEASACLSDESTTPYTRVRAGLCAMICACNLQSSERLKHSYGELLSLASTIPFRESDRLVMALVFHTELGELERGALAGRDLVALARQAGSPTFLAQSLRRHARVLRLLGRFGDARSALDEAMELAHWMGSRSYVLRAHLHIGQALIEQGDFGAAREILSRAITREDRRLFPYRAIEVAQLRAMLALIQDDETEATLVCDSRVFSKWRNRSNRLSGRPRYYSLAVSALLEVTNSSSPRFMRQIASLESEFLRLQGTGEQDFVAFALCRFWSMQGQVSRAEKILADYIDKHRRERYGVPAYLHHLFKPARAQPAQSSAGATIALLPG